MNKAWLSRQIIPKPKEAAFPILIIILIYNLLIIGAIQFILNVTPAWQLHIQRDGLVFSFKESFADYKKRLNMQGGPAYTWKPESNQLSGVAYLKIAPLKGVELPQQVFLLILNQENVGLRVISKLEIPTSAILPAEKGVQFYYFPEPVELIPGNSYAHWQQAYIAVEGLPILIKIGSIDGFSTESVLPDPVSINSGALIDGAYRNWRRSYYVILTSNQGKD